MLILRVTATTGHYRMPGQVGQGALGATYPIAPPSTVLGFLASLIGVQPGIATGEFAYGFVRPPGGRGTLTRRVSVWASLTDPAAKQVRGDETPRSIQVDTLVDLDYVVLVDGAWKEQVEKALTQGVPRTGVLCLGESTDLVDVFTAPTMPVAMFVSPGTGLVLPIAAGNDYSNMSAKYRSFSFEPGPHFFHAKKGVIQ